MALLYSTVGSTILYMGSPVLYHGFICISWLNFRGDSISRGNFQGAPPCRKHPWPCWTNELSVVSGHWKLTLLSLRVQQRCLRTLARPAVNTDGSAGKVHLPTSSTFLCSLIPRLLRVGREKRAWYTLLVHAQFLQDFWEFGNFYKISSVTLTSARHTNFSHMKDGCHWPCFVGQWWRSEKGTQLLVCRNCSHICPFSLNAVAHDWRNPFPLKFNHRHEHSNADSYHQSDIVSDFKTAQRCLVTLQCGFSAGDQKLTVILV